MSKAEGKQIAVKFTMPITGGIGHTLQSTIETQEGDWTANGTYSGSDVARAKDGSISTYWESRVANYIQIPLGQFAKFLHGFKVYCGSSYRPSSYAILTSDDGVNFTQVATGSITAQTGWQTFNLESYASANFVRISFGYTTRLYLYELILIVSDFVGGFKITGQEYKYINGPLIDKSYAIESIEAHPIEPRTLLITVGQFNRFNNVNGQLKVSYNSALGTLVGVGGAVQSFDYYFTPSDLFKEINPNGEDTINAIAIASLDYSLISYIDASSTEEHTLTAVIATATVEYTDVTIVNP